MNARFTFGDARLGAVYSGGGHRLVGFAPPSSGPAFMDMDLSDMVGADLRLAYVGKDQSGSTLDMRVEALDANGDPISDIATDSWTPTTAWAQRTATGTLPSGTRGVRLYAASAGASALVDHAEIAVGTEVTDPGGEFTNLALDSLTGWTTASGTWSLETTSHLIGSGCAECDAAGELYQQANLPAGYSWASGDTLWFACWVRGGMAVTVEIRNGDDLVVASASTLAPTHTDTWVRAGLDLAGGLSVPSSATALRIRAIGATGSMLDAPQLWIAR